MLVPGASGAGLGALAVMQAALVELGRRKGRDGRVHAVLRVQHLLHRRQRSPCFVASSLSVCCSNRPSDEVALQYAGKHAILGSQGAGVMSKGGGLPAQGSRSSANA